MCVTGSFPPFFTCSSWLEIKAWISQSAGWNRRRKTYCASFPPSWEKANRDVSRRLEEVSSYNFSWLLLKVLLQLLSGLIVVVFGLCWSSNVDFSLRWKDSSWFLKLNSWEILSGKFNLEEYYTSCKVYDRRWSFFVLYVPPNFWICLSSNVGLKIELEWILVVVKFQFEVLRSQTMFIDMEFTLTFISRSVRSS